ncbi:FKBP-type peptidyl-prolyl cis-trans isomerase [Acidianus manzaensis]|uniref:Peptidyl-prolyl cis-trans isomerase n=1 Tax=Acidianus manzaensis TaxID=282676 RepID=A0A1W6K0N6_9CREN|nr:peptidylprolyl isomerase [Acidianus manzaensis]ARM76004.1 peptidylprolyl isomerase [Acidianus manzaensis]
MFKDNDFLYIDYTSKIKDTGEVIDTTNEEEAKKANIYNPEKKYKPLLVILGEHRVIQGLEEALYNFNENEEKDFEVPPEKAYGERDPSKVKIVSLGELKRQGVNPYPNMLIRLQDGNYATVKSVSGGRVILDLNHPYAGKTILYHVKVVKVVKDDVEKLKSLLDRWFGENNKIGLELSEDKKSVKISIPKEYFLLEDLQTRKYILAKDILTYVLPESAVTYTETYNKETFKG